MATSINRFWETKTLDELTQKEWEFLCDRCGLCCLIQAEDEDTLELFSTNVICEKYDSLNNTCSCYESRLSKTSHCTQLTPSNIKTLTWLPSTCAYRLISDKKPLPESHPLISGSYSSVETVADLHGSHSLIKFYKDIDIAKYILT